MSLLPRFYDPQHGAVLLDGEDVRNYTLRDLRRQISLVSQDVVLFDDTIANNIAYGALAQDRSRSEHRARGRGGLRHGVRRGRCRKGSTRESASAARCCPAASGNASLSRARCSKDAPVLILDEATSALDTESERRDSEPLSRV